jgi:hypothetical protein
LHHPQSWAGKLVPFAFPLLLVFNRCNQLLKRWLKMRLVVNKQCILTEEPGMEWF